MSNESVQILFPLGEILSFTSGATTDEARFVPKRGMVGVRDLVEHVMNDHTGLTDTAVMIYFPKVREALLRQHPQLAQIDMEGADEDIEAWLQRQIDKFGPELPVCPDR